MTTSDYSPLLRTTVGRNTAAQHHQAIDAHYYNVTDEDAWPIAGLLVLLDGQGMPVRAELHIDDSTDDPMVEVAMRQARLLLQDQYIGGDPVSMRILETFQMRTPLEVRLPPLGARVPPKRRRAAWQTYAAGAGILLVAFLLIWLVVGALRGDEPSSAATTGGTIAPSEAVSDAETFEADATALDTGEGDGAAADGGLVSDSSAGDAGAEASALPPSRNARPDLGIGMRVRIVPGLQLALRSEPGADAGEVIGAMADSTEATIIGGPRYTQGTEDTIVWWYVELDNGVQAWAAANTSSQTLLIPTE